MKVLYHIKIATSHKYCLQMSSISEMQKNNGNAVFINVSVLFQRARDGTRTRGPDLGKVVLHQLSHSRIYSSVPDGQIILYMIFFTLSTNLFEFFTTVYFWFIFYSSTLSLRFTLKILLRDSLMRSSVSVPF